MDKYQNKNTFLLLMLSTKEFFGNFFPKKVISKRGTFPFTLVNESGDSLPILYVVLTIIVIWNKVLTVPKVVNLSHHILMLTLVNVKIYRGLEILTNKISLLYFIYRTL